MAVMGKLKDRSGQMTVEFVVMFPVALAIALIATNALLFLSDCASFDRVARNAIRVCATSPAYGEGVANCQASVQECLDREFDRDYLDCSVAVRSVSGGLMRYDARLVFHPNIFGMGLRSEFLGVSVPAASHSCHLVVDPYEPGVVF